MHLDDNPIPTTLARIHSHKYTFTHTRIAHSSRRVHQQRTYPWAMHPASSAVSLVVTPFLCAAPSDGVAPHRSLYTYTHTSIRAASPTQCVLDMWKVRARDATMMMMAFRFDVVVARAATTKPTKSHPPPCMYSQSQANTLPNQTDSNEFILRLYTLWKKRSAERGAL